MKKIVKHLAAVSAALALLSVGTAYASASAEPAAVSPALSILSGDIDMIKTGLCGSEISFTAEDFEEALGVDKLDSVVILSLPAASSGKLMLGSLEVMKNQTISRSNLAALRFVPSSAEGKIECSFGFRAGSEQKYDVTCTIHVIEKQNFAPTAAGFDESGFTLSTYKNIAVFGNMLAGDPENDELKYEIVSYPKKGILSVTDKNDGSFIYSPTKNFTGRDSFTYTVTDVYGNRSSPIKMSIQVSRSENGTVFTDLIGERCHTAAIRLSDLGIMSGKVEGEQNLFDPDGTVLRAEFLAMVMKAAGIEVNAVNETAVSVFRDDSEIPAEYKPYVIAAYQKGYVKGYDADGGLVFDPNGEITMAEACVIVSNILNAGEPVTKPVFADADEIPSWAESAIYALGSMGVIRTEDGYISPTMKLSRGDVVEILSAVLDL